MKTDRIEIVYDSKWCKRIGRVFETKIKVNLSDSKKENWRLVEKDEKGTIIDNSLPFQYDPLNESALSSGILSVYLEGESIKPRRYFTLLLDGKNSGIEKLVWIKKDDLAWEDEAAYEIITPLCRYIFHKDCGGFAGIIDNDGNDWISYHNSGGSDGAYRGIPNMIFTPQGGTFHPGSPGCSTEILSRGPIKVTLLSESSYFGVKVKWDIYPEYATMTVVESSINYWFLYEGTPGGRLEEGADYMVLPTGEMKKASESWHGYGIPWIIFADGNTDRGLFLIRHGSFGNTEDSYWPMEQNMTVWGFGRAKRQEPLTQYHSERNVKFTIGLVENANAEEAAEKVASCRMSDKATVY